MPEGISEAEFNRTIKKFDDFFREMSKVIVGQEDVLKHILASMMCGGNALLESYPGLGKTLMVRTLAAILDLKFSRIQNTPDLLPSDIIGTYIIEDQGGRKVFKFQQGPLFANIILADEINRATPKTQSALLEAMQERQVTVGTETFRLDLPFYVLATQNPIDQEGSLAPDQHVFFNGRLVSGHELLEYAKQKGIGLSDGKKSLHEIPGSWTYSLNKEGMLEKTECMVYTLPYDDELVCIRTRTGRELAVTKNHPFLVNEGGAIKWKKAEELTLDDYMISPARLDSAEEKTELCSHKEAMEKLSGKYKVVTHEDAVELKEKSRGFRDFSGFGGKDFDRLRIASELSIRKLASELGLDKKGYWKLIRFLRGGGNKDIHKTLSIFFSRNKPAIAESDFIESYTTTRINRIGMDEDIASFIAFLLSDGSFEEGYMAAYQKNYPQALEKFIETAEGKIGCGISEIREDKGGKRAVIRSKPLVDYFSIRFGLVPGSQEIPSWMVAFPENLRRTFLRTFISLESHLDSKMRRIVFSQKDRQSVNAISYMLLKEGILGWIKNERKIYRIKIQGNDFSAYLKNIGWVEGRHMEGVDANSVHRVVPVPRDAIMRLCKLLGISSFHTFKKRKMFSTRGWYSAYKGLKHGKTKITEDAFKLMMADLKGEIEYRKSLNIEEAAAADPREAAVLCGLSMGEITELGGFSRHAIWQSYSGRQQSQNQIAEFITDQYKTRIAEAESLLRHLQGLLTDYVLYDRVKSIVYKPYKGPVFGLTVPGLQNYIAGFGGCGINHNTYPLPEAQIDRFLFKILLTYPPMDQEMDIVDRYAGSSDIGELKKVMDRTDMVRLQELTRMVPISKDLSNYAVQIVGKTRQSKNIEYGASPRASIGLILAAKANALIGKRNYVVKKDIQEMAFPVLRHRVVLSFKAEKEGLKPDDVIKELI